MEFSKTTNPDSPRKYDITGLLEKIEEAYGSKVRREFILKVCRELNISEGTFRNYRYAKVGEGGKSKTMSYASLKFVVDTYNRYSDVFINGVEDICHPDVYKEEIEPLFDSVPAS